MPFILSIFLATHTFTIDRTQETLARIEWCESRGNRDAINTRESHGASYSYFQFRLSTFQEFGKRYGLPYDDIFSFQEQTAIAKRMIEEGRESEQWKVCTKLMGIDGKGDSNYINKYLTGEN